MRPQFNYSTEEKFKIQNFKSNFPEDGTVHFMYGFGPKKKDAFGNMTYVHFIQAYGAEGEISTKIISEDFYLE